jgi:hypothetical protein
MTAWYGIAALLLLGAVGIWEQFWKGRHARRRRAEQSDHGWDLRGRSSLDEPLDR